MRWCEWVNVGFIHIKLVCKHCDQENGTTNYKLERFCDQHYIDELRAIRNEYEQGRI